MLLEDQKLFINNKIEEGLSDYIVITNLLHKKEGLTGRSKEAKEVRAYLVETGFIKKKKKERFSHVKEILTDAQKTFIDQNIESSMSPKQITELLFNQKFQGQENLNIHVTSEYRAVHKFIKEKYPQFLNESESGVNQKYSVPRSIKTVLNKVNKLVGQNLNEDKLSLQHRKYLERLLVYLASPRFVGNYDSYMSAQDKD